MRVAYVGPFAYPSSQANSLRVAGMVSALAAAGHQVLVGSMSQAPPGPADEYSDGERVSYLAEYEHGFLSSLAPGIRGLFLGDCTVSWLSQLEEKPDLVILYGVHLGYLWRLRRYCRREGIALVLDVVEWYRARDLPGGRFGPFAIANELAMRFFAKSADGVIAISSFLERHFFNMGCRVLRVPPLLANAGFIPSKARARESGLTKVCYVGSPGSKEALKAMFDGFRRAVESGARIRLHFVGASLADIAASLYAEDVTWLRSEESGVVFYGRLSNEAATQVVRGCDFSMTIRERERLVEAGFPFKVAEAAAHGTPTICNEFSDLRLYFADGENAIFSESTDSASVCSALMRAAGMSDADVSRMSGAVQKVGKNEFSATAKSAAISRFLECCVAERQDPAALNGRAE
ncbi:MAG: glycosyltransferase [Polynucleobacter sp.]|nr:glycosyltransferase [Polynucleobacter sp.]